MNTTNSLFRSGYADLAIDRARDAIRTEGMSAAFFDWMRADDVRAQFLQEVTDDFAHRALLGREDAMDKFLALLKPWTVRYVEAWTDQESAEFMVEVDEEARVNAILDREDALQ